MPFRSFRPLAGCCLCCAAALLLGGAIAPGGSCWSADGDDHPPPVVIPSGPDARCVASDDAAVLAWTQATIYDPAFKAPDHPTKALELAVLRLGVNCIAHNDAQSRAAILKAIPAALSAGSTDPMVTYFDAMLTSPTSMDRGARMLTSYPTYRNSPYPPIRRAVCSLNILEVIPEKFDPARYATVHEQAYQDILAALASFPEHEHGMIRGFYPKVSAFFSDQAFITTDAIGDRMMKDLSAPGIPAWWSKTLQGLVQISQAWVARGSDTGDKVSDAQWKGFHDHLTLANSLLTAAWKLDPQRPEAAEAMIPVAMGGEDSNGSVYDWFNRAMAAQMDDQPAFDAIIYALTPRWGGSWDEMLRIGIAAADTGRYDTTTPWQLLDAVQAISQDAQEMNSGIPPQLTPAIYERCKAIVDRYRPTHPKDGPYYEVTLSILAWMCGQQAAESLRHLDAAGTRFIDEPIRKDLYMSGEAFRSLLTKTLAAPPAAPPAAPAAPAGHSDPFVP